MLYVKYEGMKKKEVEKRKKKTESIGIVFLLGLIVLSVTAVFVAPAVAEEVEDPVLWVVPEDPTRWSGPNAGDALLNETIIADVDMGTTFTSYVLVFNQESYGNPKADAEDVFLMFFVYDASNIRDITIGTAKRIQPGGSTIDPNNNSNPNVETLIFSSVDKYMGVPAGYGVNYSIGDIPFSGGSSKTGDPEPDVNNFNLNSVKS
jgi:hypothetical protein